MPNTAEIQALHAEYVLTPWLPQGGLKAPVMDHAEGRYLFDTDNNKYFDLGSGLIAVNLGHGHPKVVKAIQDQAAKLCYAAPSLMHEARAELAKALSDMSPFPEGAKVFFGTTGAEANDDVVRLARALTGRNKILAAFRSFHGATGTAITLTGEDRRFGGEHMGAPGVVRFFAPYPFRSPFFTSDPKEECERALDHLERTLLHENPERVAALLIEPVVGSNGVIVYPEGYLAGLRKITERHGILLVFDEVMTGFGRTGAAFAATRFGVCPDMISFAKGVTSAYLPLGGVLMRKNLAKMFDERALPCGHTYSGHPMAVAAGLATVKAYEEEKLFPRALALEETLRARLGKIKDRFDIVGDARGVGAFFALEFVKNKKSNEPLVPWHGAGMGVMKDLYAGLRKEGIFTFGKFNVCMVAPPLTTTDAELDGALTSLERGIETFQKSLG